MGSLSLSTGAWSCGANDSIGSAATSKSACLCFLWLPWSVAASGAAKIWLAAGVSSFSGLLVPDRSSTAESSHFCYQHVSINNQMFLQIELTSSASTALPVEFLFLPDPFPRTNLAMVSWLGLTLKRGCLFLFFSSISASSLAFFFSLAAFAFAADFSFSNSLRILSCSSRSHCRCSALVRFGVFVASL